MYQVKKRFTDGVLNGIVVSEMTEVPFEIGEEVKRSSFTGSSYVIESVVRLY